MCLIEEASQSLHSVRFVLNSIPKAVLTSEAGLGIVEVLWEPPRSYFVYFLGILALMYTLSALIRLTCLSLPQSTGGGETKILSFVTYVGKASQAIPRGEFRR